jgi:hypothetical protein
VAAGVAGVAAAADFSRLSVLRYRRRMPNEALVAAVKNIVSLMKAGKQDAAYAGYAELFSGPLFPTVPVTEQRQTLKFMILAKGIPTFPTPPVVKAHAAAVGPLKALVAAHNEPQDYELLGLCQVRTDDEKGARATFQKGLDLERARDPQSPLCGQLMKWVASV